MGDLIVIVPPKVKRAWPLYTFRVLAVSVFLALLFMAISTSLELLYVQWAP